MSTVRHMRIPFTNVQVAALAFAVMAHLSADIFLISQTWLLFSPLVFVLLAVPLSQNALVTWAALKDWSTSYVRFSLALLTAVWTWFVVLDMIGWGLQGHGAPAWALGFATQSIAIVAVIVAARRITFGSAAKELRFGLTTMLGWITVAAIVLGLVRNGPRNWGWSTSDLMWDYSLLMPVICLATALTAVVVFSTLSTARPIWQRLLMAAIVFPVIGCCVPLLVTWIWNTDIITIGVFTSLVLMESVLLYVTLIPLRYVLANPTRTSYGVADPFL